MWFLPNRFTPWQHTQCLSMKSVSGLGRYKNTPMKQKMEKNIVQPIYKDADRFCVQKPPLWYTTSCSNSDEIPSISNYDQIATAVITSTYC